MSNKDNKANKGIPIENENVSKDPNRSPKGDDRNKNVNINEGYVEPYNKKKYQEDPKNNH
jgi:hypothetical protein